MDMSAISGAISSAKVLKDVLQALATLKVEKATLARINEALNQVHSVQEALFDSREELFKLQKDNDDLRRKLKEHDDWETSKAKYQILQTLGGAIVYASKTESPNHFARPRCMSKREIQILQDIHVNSGGFERPNCKEIYSVKPAIETRVIRSGPSFF